MLEVKEVLIVPGDEEVVVVLVIDRRQVGEEIPRVGLHPADLAGEKGKKVHTDAHDPLDLGDGPDTGDCSASAIQSTRSIADLCELLMP